MRRSQRFGAPARGRRLFAYALIGAACAAGGCSSGGHAAAPRTRAMRGDVSEGTCQIVPAAGGGGGNGAGEAGAGGVVAGAEAASAATNGAPDYLSAIGCTADYTALASLPTDATIPGARSVKFVIDTRDLSSGADAKHRSLYFQNSVKYPFHVNFCCTHIKGVSCDESQFLDTYYSANRRFIAGAITHYEKLDLWALEMAPYDTATPDMIQNVFDTITTANAFFRPGLAFHPTSDAWASRAEYLDLGIPIVTTEEIYAGTDYQPLTRATASGVVRYYNQADIQAGVDIPYNSIVVLDEVPNDISVVAGVVSEQFQSPLSHVNVLCTNRGTPNMGLRDARAKLLAYKDKWVELSVGIDGYDIHEIDAATGEAAFLAHQPAQVTLPELNLAVTEIADAETLIADYPSIPDVGKRGAIQEAVRAYGGKAANFSVMAQAGGIPVPKAFAIPVYWYDKFMRDNGFYDTLDALLQNPDFTSSTDSSVRRQSLQDLRDAMMTGVIDDQLQNALREKLEAEFVGNDGRPLVMRFRTSTNSEDLDAFPCAGCYESHTGDPSDWPDVLKAIRSAYSSAWLFRTFEERSYYRVDHKSVGMALLVHHRFDGEVANGVAITSNPYDSSGADSARYVNVEFGGAAEVVHLPSGVTTDQFLYFANGSTSYISRSNLVAKDQHVLSDAQIAELGSALDAVHQLFASAYKDPGSSWYAMDSEFKFIACDALGNPTDTPTLWIKQARPYPSPFAAVPAASSSGP